MRDHFPLSSHQDVIVSDSDFENFLNPFPELIGILLRVSSTLIVMTTCRVCRQRVCTATQVLSSLPSMTCKRIQVAVAQFQKQLSDQQRARFNALQLAATP
jgi:hypothetical protein